MTNRIRIHAAPVFGSSIGVVVSKTSLPMPLLFGISVFCAAEDELDADADAEADADADADATVEDAEADAEEGVLRMRRAR